MGGVKKGESKLYRGMDKESVWKLRDVACGAYRLLVTKLVYLSSSNQLSPAVFFVLMVLSLVLRDILTYV